MGFDDDEGRWLEFLRLLNLLSMSHYTGSFRMHWAEGRVCQRTIQHLRNVNQEFVSQEKREAQCLNQASRL